MGERRNHKTSWDTVEETKPPSGMGEHNSWMGKESHSRHQSGNHDEFSASGWASWDSVEGKPTAPTNDGVTKSQLNALDRKEIETRTRHHRDVSPGFKGRHTSNHTIEKDRNDSHRHLDRGRSRSRSRTRGRSRSRSRSLSRGREKGRKRSRSRGDNGARDRSIPGGDYARKSYGSSDRITGSEKSSQLCRSFASGRCMKGSQCRFLHNDDANRSNKDHIEDHKEDGQRRIVDRDRTSKHSDDIIRTSEDLVEDHKEESWRNKSDGGRSSKQPDITIRRNEDIIEDQKGESWKKRSDRGHSSKHRDDTIHRNEDLVEDQKEESWRNRSDHGGRSLKHPGDTINRSEDLVEDQKGENWRSRSDRGHTSRHCDDTIRRNEDRVEDQKEERWRNRADPDHTSRHSYDRGHGSEPRDGISDSYRGDEEKFRSKGRKSIPCRDFISGNCRYGDNCKYSHTSGDSLGKGVRKASFDRDTERQPQNGSPMCKFFVAGYCGNENCRFSHENPRPSSIEGRQGESTNKNSVHVKDNKWDGPTWGDAAKNLNIKRDNSSNRENKVSPPRKIRKYGEGRDISESDGRRGDKDSTWNEPTWDDAARNSENVSSGWNETIVAKTTSSDDIKNGKYDDIKRDWEGRPDNSRENKSPPPRERGSSRRERGTSDSVGIKGEGRRAESTDMDNTWNGPTWEDAAKISETMSSGWNEIVATKKNSSDDIKNDRKRDWEGGPGIFLNRENKSSPLRERVSSRRDRGTSESIGRRVEDRRGEVTDKHSLHGKDNTWNGPTRKDATKNSETLPSVWTESIATEVTSSDDTRNGKRDDRKRESQGREDKSSPPRERGSSRRDRRTSKSIGRRGEDRRGEINEKHSLHSKDNTWNGPTWDDAAKTFETVPSVWTETIATETTSSDDTRYGKRDDRKRESQGRENKSSPAREVSSSWKDQGTTESVGQRGEFTEKHSLQDKANTWNWPTLDDVTKNSDNVACGWNNMQGNWHDDTKPSLGSCGDGRVITESVSKENISEEHLISHPSRFNQAGFPSFQEETVMHEEQTFTKQNVSPAAHVEQQHLDVDMDILIPNGSNGTSTDLNGPGIEMTYPLGIQAQMQNHLEAVQPPEPPGLNIPFAPEPIVIDPVTDPMIVNEASQTYADVEMLNPPPPTVVGKEFNYSTVEQVRSPKLKQGDVIVDTDGNGSSNKAAGKENNGLQENKVSETVDGNKAEENNANKDEKGTRLFKNALIELVKELVKPKWKEGKMTRDDHKTIVKKTVEKVTSAIAPEHVPKTQDKVDLYLLSSKPKISKLVQAYAERCLKKDS